MVGGVVATTPAALATEIRHWLSDASRRDLARANAAKFLRRYDLNRIADSWMRRYRRLSRSVNGEAV
jgi:glycosyltransferase involved in cell wall biosynthesis